MKNIENENRNALWQELLQKIQSDWNTRYKNYGSFESFPNIRGLHALGQMLHLDIEKSVQKKQSNTVGLISTSSVYRILLNGRGFANAHINTLNTISIYLGYEDWNGYKKVQKSKNPQLIFASPDVGLPLLTRSLPFETCDSERALIILSERLRDATHVYNTRITGKNVAKIPYSKKAMVWQDALIEFVPKDGTFLKEILSDLWIPEVQELLLLDDYKAYNLNYEVTSFLNFIVLFYNNGTKEVWIGWLLSEHKHLEQPCFVFREDKIVSLFMEWFKDLQKDSTQIFPS